MTCKQPYIMFPAMTTFLGSPKAKQKEQATQNWRVHTDSRAVWSLLELFEVPDWSINNFHRHGRAGRHGSLDRIKMDWSIGKSYEKRGKKERRGWWKHETYTLADMKWTADSSLYSIFLLDYSLINTISLLQTSRRKSKGTWRGLSFLLV